MQNSVKSIETRMIAVIGLELEKIEEILNKFKNKEFLCEIANDNCPGQIILSGLKKSVTDVEKQLIEAGARSIIDLKVSAPFHCSLMKSASLIMEKALEDINLIKPMTYSSILILCEKFLGFYSYSVILAIFC